MIPQVGADTDTNVSGKQTPPASSVVLLTDVTIVAASAEQQAHCVEMFAAYKDWSAGLSEAVSTVHAVRWTVVDPVAGHRSYAS
jgi:hypothetical protein